MKKLLRKNQIIITALIIMVAVAGYLSLSKDEEGLLSVTDTADISNSLQADTDISDADISVLDDDGESVATGASAGAVNTTDKKTENEATKETAANDTANPASSETSKENAGEAVMVGNNVSSSYFESAKLAREQTRAKNKETLLELVNNTKATEKQKEKAMNEIVNMTEISEKETATENLLAAKGFTDVVVSIVDDSVDVIVNAKNLTEQQIAQIEDIVKRKTEVASDKIVISPVGKNE